MSLGTPSIGISTNYFSEYQQDIDNGTQGIQSLLSRLLDNTSNLINPKDVRDPIWTIWNKIQDLQNQISGPNLYTLGTPSTIDIGGIIKGSTFSSVTFKQLFDILLLPFVEPDIQFELVPNFKEFGDNKNINISYNISVGSAPISSIEFLGPNPITPSLPTGNDPDIGIKSAQADYFTTIDPFLENNFTLIVNTSDGNSYNLTKKFSWYHKFYYGQIVLNQDFNTNVNSSGYISAFSQLTNSFILSLQYNKLSQNFDFSQIINFNSSHFVIAFPTKWGDPFPEGFYINNVFINDFTRIKTAVMLVNDLGFQEPYNIWISNFKLWGDIKVNSGIVNIDPLTESGFRISQFTIDLMDDTSINIYAPNNMFISNVENLVNNPLLIIEVNDTGYTIGDSINKGDKIYILSNIPCVINLIIYYE